MSMVPPPPAGSATVSTLGAGALPDAAGSPVAVRPAVTVVQLLRKKKILIAPVVVLVLFVLVGVFAPYLAPRSPTETALGMKLTPPAWLPDGVSERLLG